MMDPMGDQHRQVAGELSPLGGLKVPAPRRARMDDVDEVVRLAELMYGSMGMDASGEDWRRTAIEHVRRRLGDDVAVFVIDAPTCPGRLAATGAGSIATRLPSPVNPSARVGYMQWVVTEPAWRRRGFARAIAAALVDWFADRGVPSVELHATRDGEGLYRTLGFQPGPNPGLRRRLD